MIAASFRSKHVRLNPHGLAAMHHHRRSRRRWSIATDRRRVQLLRVMPVQRLKQRGRNLVAGQIKLQHAVLQADDPVKVFERGIHLMQRGHLGDVASKGLVGECFEGHFGTGGIKRR